MVGAEFFNVIDQSAMILRYHSSTPRSARYIVEVIAIDGSVSLDFNGGGASWTIGDSQRFRTELEMGDGYRVDLNLGPSAKAAYWYCRVE